VVADEPNEKLSQSRQVAHGAITDSLTRYESNRHAMNEPISLKVCSMSTNSCTGITQSS
jgi:hypothetical protein